MPRLAARRSRLLRALRKRQLATLLVTNFTNVTYLTGFTGDDSFLLLSREACVMVSDGRYRTQIAEECPGLDAYIRPTGEKMPEAVAKVVRKAHLAQLGFEADSMTVSARDQIAKELPKVELVATTGAVEQLRLCKDAGEVAEIRRAIHLAEKAFAVFRAGLSGEMTEKQGADDLEHALRRVGATSASFPPIVAVGARAALPHARPTNRRIGEADFVLVDWGATGHLYQSDLTRLLVTGRISPKLEKAYRVVLRAQEKAIGKIRPGALARDIDAEARSVIQEAGFGRFFYNSLGHGLGLEVHEGPGLRSSSAVRLEPGMVVTVEPGIYFPGWGGVRIEDDVLITRGGHEVLSRCPKQFDQMVLR